jgi:hypothetical protein
MTVESTTTKHIYKGNGTARSWAVTYRYSETADIKLIMTTPAGVESAVTSNFSISVSSSGATTVTYPVTGAALASGYKLTIYRQTPQKQIVDLIYGGAFNPDVLEHDGFDRAVMMIQELQEEVGRSIKVSISDPNPPETAEKFYADMQGFADSAASSASSAASSATSAKTQADRADAILADVTATGEQAIKDMGVLVTQTVAARNGAELFALQAGGHAHDALQSEQMARRWASNPENVLVWGGMYSAFHWAQKAMRAAEDLEYDSDLMRSMLGQINNIWALLEGTPGLIEDYGLITEAVTESEDYGLITDPVTAVEDFGNLLPSEAL